MNGVLAPDPQAIAVMVLTVIALLLFSRSRIPIETSSLVVIALLAIGFVLFPYENEGKALDPTDFLLGFGNDALIAICALMIAGRALIRTGALTPIARVVSKAWKVNPRFALLFVLLATAPLSAFINNTPQVVLMIPILISVGMRSGMPASKTLMPMSFATQVGGMGTPIGTGLNLLVISTAASLGVPRFEMFDFVAPAAIAGIVAILYLWLIAPLLLPKRDTALADTSPRIFTARLTINEDSFAEGKTLAEVLKRTEDQMQIVRVERGPGTYLSTLPDLVFKAGDRLVVKDTPERLKEFERSIDATLYTGDEPSAGDHPLASEDQQIAELVVIRASLLDGKTLNEVDFDDRFKLAPLALHRAEHPVEREREHLRELRLRMGDVVLVQGRPEQIAELKQGSDFLVVDATTDVPRTRKAPIAAAIMAGIVALAVFQILPIVFAALAGVLLMIATGCLRWRDAVGALDAPLIFLTAASIALSLALVKTGAADFIARSFVELSAGMRPAFILSGLILLMAIMANVISNSAAAVIGTPIGISIASALGAPPEPFVLAVLFGVNMAYATPVADNCNLLVYSAGGYQFSDFVRVGIPLLAIMWVAYSLLLPIFFPLAPV